MQVIFQYYSSVSSLFLKVNNSSNENKIDVINILSDGTKTKAMIETILPIKKGIGFFIFLYCSIQRTINKAVKENSKPAVSNLILEPIIAPRVEPINQ